MGGSTGARADRSPALDGTTDRRNDLRAGPEPALLAHVVLDGVGAMRRTLRRLTVSAVVLAISLVGVVVLQDRSDATGDVAVGSANAKRAESPEPPAATTPGATSTPDVSGSGVAPPGDRTRGRDPGGVVATPPPRVVLVGDSLLAMAEPQMRATLDEVDLVVDGRGGHTIAQQHDRATRLAADDPDAMVFVLGANDANPSRFSRADVEHDVAALLDAVEHVECVRWVTVQEDFYVDGTEDMSLGTLTVNVTLMREAAERDNLELVDFAPVINERPAWHVIDPLHLDDRGSQAMADLVADSLGCVHDPGRDT